MDKGKKIILCIVILLLTAVLLCACLNEKYTVHFESNGGSNVNSVTIWDDNKFVFPEEPTKEGFLFAGWFMDDETFLQPFRGQRFSDSETTVYAKWVLINNGGYAIDKGKLVQYVGDETSIVIPDSVTSIGDRAFLDCHGLTSVSISDSVSSIGACAFAGCSGLTSISIPDSVSSIGASAFEGCSGLASVSVPDGLSGISASMFEGCSELTSLSIPDSVTGIGASAFKGSGLTSVSIPQSVTAIEYSTFENCGGLSSVTVPNNVRTIDFRAFKNCTGLETVNTGNSLIYIGYEAFFGTPWLIHQPDGLVYISKVLYQYKGVMPSDTSITLLPDTKGIADSAFVNCTNLISIVLFDNLITIGSNAFYGCSRLTTVTIPETVQTIGDQAFYGCHLLKSVKIHSINPPKVGSHVFYSSENLNKPNLYVPDQSMSSYFYLGLEVNLYSMDIIDHNGFAVEDTHLIQYTGTAKNINIPYGVRTIDRRAFLFCIGITSLSIPGSVTEIDYAAFKGCTGLSSVTIPDSVTDIGACAFEGCTGLDSVTISANVTDIGEYPFFLCVNLKSVTFLGATPPDTDHNTLIYQLSSAKIYVPIDSIEIYKTEWSGISAKIYPIT